MMGVREILYGIGTAQVLAFVSRSLVCFVEAGSQKSYGILVEELSMQANMSFTLTGLILPLQKSMSRLVSPLAAALYQRLGPRITIMCGGLLVAFGYLGNGLLPQHPVLLFTFCLCAGIGSGVAFTPTYVYLKEAFPDKTAFGIVQGLADQFMYVGIAILPVIFDRFQRLYGTQNALVLFGGINLNLLVVGVISKPISPTKRMEWNGVVKESRTEENEDDETHSVKPQKENFEESHIMADFKNRQQMKQNGGKSSNDTEEEIRRSNHGNQSNSHSSVFSRNPSLVFLLLVTLAVAFTYSGWALFLIPLGKEKGLSPEDAVLLSTFAGTGAVIGRIWNITLFLYHVQSPFHFFGLPCLLQTVLFFLLAKGPSDFWTLAGISFVSGISFGSSGSSVGGVCSLIVRETDFQDAIVLTFMTVAAGSEIGGCTAGAVRDATGSNQAVFLVLTGSNFYVVIVSIIWSVFECHQIHWKNSRASL